jgi:hypothetical protein
MGNQRNKFLTKVKKIRLCEEQKVVSEEVAIAEARRYDLPPKLRTLLVYYY